jgi:thiol:disulfide interchange protein DsbC
MMTRSILASIIAGAMVFGVVAQEKPLSKEELQQVAEKIAEDRHVETFRQNVKEDLSGKGEIIGIQPLPIDKAYFVEASKGTYIVTADGRFVIEGTVRDVWHNKVIDSLADAQSTVRTPLKNMNFDPLEDLPAWQVGNPDIPRQGLVFVDPTSDITQTFLKHVIANSEKYNFTVSLMPLIGGEPAMERAVKLHCAEDRELALVDLANYTKESFVSTRKDCDTTTVMFGMVVKDIFRVNSLPHFVREDGLVSHGYPTDLDAWLAHK